MRAMALRDSYTLGKALSVALLVALTFSSVGCEMDSWMDPSVVGRWEHTPVTMPILDRLDVIEDPDDDIPGLSQPTAEDLVPQVTEYVLGPGDFITVTILELLRRDVETVQQRRLDELGNIRLPVVGQIKAAGLTTKQLEQVIVNALFPDVLQNPTVTVELAEGRQKTFNVVGAVGAVGTYQILKSNFRLMDAVALARGLPAGTEKVYIIRQVPLNDVVDKGFQYQEDAAPGSTAPPLSPNNGEGSSGGGSDDNLGDLIEGLSDDLDAGVEGGNDAAGNAIEAALDPDPTAGPIDTRNLPSLEEGLEPDAGGEGRWVNINDKWVQVQSGDTSSTTNPAGIGADGGLPPAEQLVTQRVIEIDAKALMNGEAKYNIVIRPDDIIRVPDRTTGNVYVGGEIARPGTYALPGPNELTLKQLIISAGGFTPVAIPERVDLVRRIDRNSEATVRLNARAIFEGLQPDIYLKPDDMINVGTNLPASFIAVIRNGFRTTYGFGFLLDRNFGTDVFGSINSNGN